MKPNNCKQKRQWQMVYLWFRSGFMVIFPVAAQNCALLGYAYNIKHYAYCIVIVHPAE